MSKPSITNCPNTFFMKVHSFMIPEWLWERLNIRKDD